MDKRRCCFLETALQFFGNGAAVFWKRRCIFLETALLLCGNDAALLGETVLQVVETALLSNAICAGSGAVDLS